MNCGLVFWLFLLCFVLLLWTPDISDIVFVASVVNMLSTCWRRIFLTLQPASTFEQFYFCIVTLFLFGCLCCGLRIFLTLSVLSCLRAEIDQNSLLALSRVVVSVIDHGYIEHENPLDLLCVFSLKDSKGLRADRQTHHLERPFRCFEAETN